MVIRKLLTPGLFYSDLCFRETRLADENNRLNNIGHKD